MKNFALILFALTLVMAGCKKEEENVSYGGGSGSSTGQVTGPEGSSFTVTYPDGSTASLNGATVIGWDGGQLLNYNFWKQLRISVDGNTFFLRYNMVQDTDWSTEVQEEHGLYNFPFLLEYSSDMDDTFVELYCPFCDDFDENASGTVTLELDKPTVNGVYDVVGEIDATFTLNGQQTHIEGSFWAQELD
ncbi:hypothetical protein [Sanyastnella coralliicola]|uniref:hypothetical protein n=1 Tax=Sanyastnella coralliicola TaxID=3069118 RepID=UPI0027B97BEC|nr:hypothetical protein [Longitalea sp. SCSIO 12813]